MGKRGPKTKEKIAKLPAKSIPRAPRHLDAPARRQWNKLAGLINDSGLGSALDEDAMTFYIATWSRWRKAEDELAKAPATEKGGDGGGEVITAVNGYKQLNPWYTVATDCLKQLKSYLSEFGLSPKARSKLVLPEAEEVDSKWDEFDD